MIELPATTAIMLYFSFTLGALLLIWGSYHFGSRKKKLNLFPQKLIVCEYCHSAYLDKVSKTVTKCPQCLSFNKDRC